MDSFETACKHWDTVFKDFVEQLSDGTISSLVNIQWIYEKKRTKVCSPDDSGKKKRCAAGPKYYSEISLNCEEANAIWKAFKLFSETNGLCKIERLRNNEKELGLYNFKAENKNTGDSFSCLISLPGEWNSPRILLSLFIGSRYQDKDLIG